MAIIATPTQRESWLHRVLPDRVSNLIADEENGSGRPRRAIDYLPNFHRYRDDLNGERVAEEVEDDEGESTPQQRAIDQGVQTARDGLPGTIREQQVEHSPLDNAWART